MLSAAVVAVFGASFYLTMRLVFTGREVTVPDLAGLPVDEARAVLNRSELYLETAGERYDERFEKGRIRSQDPPAGSTLKKSRKVRVVVSLGRLEVAIPDVTGQRFRTVQLELQRQGLAVGHVSSTREPGVPADTVLAQHPRPTREGATPGPVMAAPGDATPRIDLLVDRGEPDRVYVMPDLTRRRLEEVTSFVRRAGLRLGAIRRERIPDAPRGTVVRQYPQAGYPVVRQDIISLILSE